MTRVEGDAPMGRLMRDNYWIPFALSAHLVHGDAPMPVRLFGENYVAFRAEDGRIGFLDELCPHRRSSLAPRAHRGQRRPLHLPRVEDRRLRLRRRVPDPGPPTRAVRRQRRTSTTSPSTRPADSRGCGSAAARRHPSPSCPSRERRPVLATGACRAVPCNWLQGLEGSVDSVHVGDAAPDVDRATPSSMAEHANLSFALAQAADLRDRVHLVRLAGGGAAQDRRRSAPTCASPSTSCRSSPSCRSGSAEPRDGVGVRHRAGRRHPPSALLRVLRPTRRTARSRPTRSGMQAPGLRARPVRLRAALRGDRGNALGPGPRRSWTPGTSPASGGACSRRTS